MATQWRQITQYVCWLERRWEDRRLTAQTVVEQHCGQRQAEAKMEERERLRLWLDVNLRESAPDTPLSKTTIKATGQRN